jgi:hypothetical protein
MSDESNVVAFAPRPVKVDPPPLQFIEVRLRDENCNLQVNVCDTEGNIFSLEFALKSSEGFDLNRLRRAWAEWRGAATVAS